MPGQFQVCQVTSISLSADSLMFLLAVVLLATGTLISLGLAAALSTCTEGVPFCQIQPQCSLPVGSGKTHLVFYCLFEFFLFVSSCTSVYCFRLSFQIITMSLALPSSVSSNVLHSQPRKPSSRLTVLVSECPHVVLCVTDNHSCPMDQFKCPTNRCIPKRWLCDGTDDCGDNEDESNSTCSGRLSGFFLVSPCSPLVSVTDVKALQTYRCQYIYFCIYSHLLHC